MGRKKDKKAVTIVGKLVEALQWCSGSSDFAPGGKARKGWLKICAPLLKKGGVNVPPTTQGKKYLCEICKKADKCEFNFSNKKTISCNQFVKA